MRRGVPSNRRFVAGPGRWTPSGKAGLFLWSRGDDPGASINTTPDPDQYASIPDYGGVGRTLSQATSGNQPQVSTLWAPGSAPLFSGGRRFVHSSSAAGWGTLHIGSSNYVLGMVFHCVGALTFRQIFSTYNGGASNSGMRWTVYTNGSIEAQYGNGSANSSITSTAGAVVQDTTYVTTIVKTGAGVSLRLAGSQVASGTIASPSSSAPQNTLIVGADSNGNSPHIGAIPEIVMFSGSNLPAVETIESYLSRWKYVP